MRPNVAGRAGAGGRRTALPLAALVVLLAVVAIASTGGAPAGSGGARRPSEELLDAVLSLVLVAVLAGAVGFFYVYYIQRVAAHERRRRGEDRANARNVVKLLAVAALLVALVLRFGLGHHGHGPSPVVGAASAAEAAARDARHTGYRPRFAPVPVAVVLGAAFAAGLAGVLARRARHRSLGRLPADSPLALADVLDETLDDLRAETDPRRAVIAAYARLERALAAFGLPRREAEASGEYLHRLLLDLDVGSMAATRLTELFEHAKFSQHVLDAHSKEEAIGLLAEVREGLRAAEALGEASATAAGAPA